MANEQKSLGVAALLAAFPLTGIFGADKFYVGATSMGVVQVILVCTIIGMIVSGPWSMLSEIVLCIAVFTTPNIPYLYPTVDWAPVKTSDKVMVGIAIVLLLVSVFGGLFAAAKGDSKKDDDKKT